MNSDTEPSFSPARTENASSPRATLHKTLLKRRRLPGAQTLEELLTLLRPSERLLLYGFSALLGLSVLILFVAINREASVVVPSRGGNLTEGAIGPVRFINPLLATSQMDKDLSKLIFSGLTKTLPNGSTIPDLATSYEISEDGKTYAFTLRDGLTFHDGEPLTAADVVFTVRMAQHRDVKSPRLPDWEGVTIESPDEDTIIFTLPNAYAQFLENTTLGVLPEHLWKDVPPGELPFSPLNTNPIGSGPFMLKTADTDRTGAITKITLSAFNTYALGEPHLRRFTFRIFPDEKTLVAAHRTGVIDSFVGTIPVEMEMRARGAMEFHTTLPRIFGVFFNQSHNVLFAESAVRQALDAAIGKRSLIDDSLGGFGTALEGPIPPTLLSPNAAENDGEEARTEEERIEHARTLLANGGWSFNEAEGTWFKKKKPLTFTLATADTPELVRTAEYLVNEWKKAGIKAELKVYAISELNNTVIRPRAYDALLFGEVVGKTLDLFAFWHSSQRNDPGLNLALYTNTRADSLLEKARAETDPEKRREIYRSFVEIVQKDTPAIFLYAPQFMYVLPNTVGGVTLGSVANIEDRLSEAHAWYIDTERVWSVFTDTNNSN